MSVHHLPITENAEARIAALKERHAAELDQAYSDGVETALLNVCIAVALVTFWVFAVFVVVLPLYGWLVS
jgi:hypothetical protein